MRHRSHRAAAAVVGLCLAGTLGVPASVAAAGTTQLVARTVTSRSAPLFLINGQQMYPQQSAPSCFTYESIGGPNHVTGPVQTLSVGGTTYAIPAAARPYFNRGLAASLFDVNAVAAAEAGDHGRLPVHLEYSGKLPQLPGLTVTATSEGVAVGYLTQAGAAKFGAALAHQMDTNQAAPADGLFLGGTSISLATASPAASQPAAGKTVTVTLKGTDRDGKPANGDNFALLFNVDNSAKFDNPGTSFAQFRNGTATFHVPPGHYWAAGEFYSAVQANQSFQQYADVVPQFTVTSASTLHLSAQAATSELQTVTAKPSMPQSSSFQIVRYPATGIAIALGWIQTDDGPGSPIPPLYVNPTKTAPTVGKLVTATSEQLGTAAYWQGSQYQYNVAFRSAGVIPSMRHVVSQGKLATLHLRAYSAVKSYGLVSTNSTYPFQQACPPGAVLFWADQFPAQKTEYLSTGQQMSWNSVDILSTAAGFSGGQVTGQQVYQPGQQATLDLGAYPLHPVPDYRAGNLADLPPTQVSASRAGNTLRLALNAFSDSVPGHYGQGTFLPAKASGSYEVLANGVEAAGGTLKNFYGAFQAAVPLKKTSSYLQLELNTAEPASVNPLSTSTQTQWGWLAPLVKSKLPAGWTCLPGGEADASCTVQPMLTLRYGVLGESLDGTTAPGRQSIRLSVGHIQLAHGSAIDSAAMSYSFDGGKTWHKAQVTGTNGSYVASFTAPADSLVTLRTSATDVNGGSITETITNAYQVAYEG